MTPGRICRPASWTHCWATRPTPCHRRCAPLSSTGDGLAHPLGVPGSALERARGHGLDLRRWDRGKHDRRRRHRLLGVDAFLLSAKTDLGLHRAPAQSAAAGESVLLLFRPEHDDDSGGVALHPCGTRGDRVDDGLAAPGARAMIEGRPGPWRRLQSPRAKLLVWRIGCAVALLLALRVVASLDWDAIRNSWLFLLTGLG